ncbi:MAG: sigma-70 family RNA polymerase sigma factor [Ruminococcaceae bacterium]|nr:sigma-70 family RNA polymerase sigma factor [Oscillospiraceae bacterium]
MGENVRLERHYELLAMAQSDEEQEAAKATEILICENMGLVRNAAMRFRDRGTEYEDLLQIGTIGMLRAIRTFDLSRGTAFSTFAVPLIVGEIRRHLRDDGIIRVSRNYKRLAAELTAKRREIAEREGREATLEELAMAVDVSKEEAATALAAITPVTSLSDCAFEEEKGELAERITDDESANEPAILSDRIALRAAIERMPALWRKILLLRYYRDCTQQQTADVLGLSQVKVSREEKKILSFLRREMIV